MAITILCYHKVSLDELDGTWLNVTPTTLRKHAEFFLRRGYSIVTAETLAGNWPANGVCFTFDDAYVSAVENVRVVFEPLKIPATFYVVPGKVGKTSDWDADKARPLANWEALAAAKEAGHEIGNHTMHHVHLGDVSREEQREEVLAADRELEDRGFGKGSFCYPYGSYSQDTIHVLGEAGYKVSVALGKRQARPEDNRLALPRIVMAYRDSPAMLLYKLYVRPRLP